VVKSKPIQIPSARRLGVRHVLALLLACGVLIGTTSGVRIVKMIDDALVEGDDFTPYWNGGSAVAAGVTPYAWLDENRPQELPDYIYPPLLAVLMSPLPGLTDYPTARWGWLAFSVASLVAAIWLVCRASGLQLGDARALAAAPLVALVPPATLALGIGQISPQLLLLLAAAYFALAAGRSTAAGGLIAFTAYLKSFPGLLIADLLVRRRWRALAACVLIGSFLVALTVLAVGWEPHWTYLTRVIPAQQRWVAGPFNISINGFLSRVFTANQFASPIVDLGSAAQALIALATVAVLAVTGYAVWQAPAEKRGEDAAFALVVTASLLVSPINGNYNLIILVLPLLVAAARIQAAWPHRLRWLLLAALLLGMPIEYRDLWPVDPMPWRVGWGNLLTAGPFVGLVTLWALMVRLCLERGEIT
jgi:hypothetical protein